MVRRGRSIPIALPEVDFVLMALAGEDEEGEEIAPRVIPYDELYEAVEGEAEKREEPRRHLLARFEEAPIDLVKEFLEEAEIAESQALSGLPAERVFDAELIEQME